MAYNVCHATLKFLNEMLSVEKCDFLQPLIPSQIVLFSVASETEVSRGHYIEF